MGEVLKSDVKNSGDWDAKGYVESRKKSRADEVAKAKVVKKEE